DRYQPVELRLLRLGLRARQILLPDRRLLAARFLRGLRLLGLARERDLLLQERGRLGALGLRLLRRLRLARERDLLLQERRGLRGARPAGSTVRARCRR